jgi:hypothetical protein
MDARAQPDDEGLMRATKLLFASALVAATATGAVADPAAVGHPRMTVPAKQGVLHALIEMNLSKDAAFKPVSIAPDLWYGATSKLTLGLVHSGRAAAGFLGGFGDGLCVTGEDNGCAKVYDSAGLLARYHLKDGPFTVAADGGLLASSFDPFAVSLKLGVATRWHGAKVAIDFAPNLAIAISERDGANQDVINLPVTLSYAVAPRLALAAQSGIASPLEDLSDNFLVPLSVGAQILATDKVFVDLAFSLPALLGGNSDVTGTDLRSLTVGGGYAF